MTRTTTPKQVRAIVGATGGGTSASRGAELHEFVRTHRFGSCLELGFKHGVSSLYIASALEANNYGNLVSVDLQSAKGLTPEASSLISQAGLASRVRLVHEASSYTWFLHDLLAEQAVDGTIVPIYDFVFLDGAHTWDVDGFAFFLVDKLLRPGGWVLFDDLNWRLDPVRFPDVPAYQRDLAQVSDVFHLLALTHPNYVEARNDGEWGWIRKSEDVGNLTVRTVYQRDLVGQFREIRRLVLRKLSR